MVQIKVIDYDAGNLFNVVRAFEHLGCRTQLVSRADDINGGDILVLPGVGAFGDGMSSLNGSGLVAPLREWIDAGKPFIGICLGMQLLLSSSEEFGRHQGLEIVPGMVRRLPAQPQMKVPNIGWHPLQPVESASENEWLNSPLQDVSCEQDMYFVHSYAAYPETSEHWLARTAFGEHWFCSVLRKDNVFGCQFHPEKSGAAGLSILTNFLRQIL